MGGAIGAVMLAGSMKTLQLSLETSQVARSTLSEAEFRHIINQFFTDKDKCLANFKPKTPVPTASPYSIGLYGDNREWGVGEVFKLDSAIPLEKGGDFKGDLKIVKMELKGDLPTTPPPDGDKITKKEATRHFIVYYKKRGLGSYSTVGGADCKANNLSGCYFNRCVLTLKLEPNPPDTKEEKCESTCTAVSGGGGGSGNPDCYKVDDSKTLVGCDATTDAGGTDTTAIGYGAGKANVGSGNTFVGSGAGKTVTRGKNNIVIGSNVQLESPTGNNQINIGNIIRTKTGVITVCNPDGSDCKAVGKQQDCGEGKVVQGIKSDGTLDCKPGCSGGRSLFETLKFVNVDGQSRTRSYEVGSPPYILEAGELLVSKKRSCKCTGGLKWDHLTKSCKQCTAGFKWVLVDGSRACMSCRGQWEFLNGEYQCKCTPPKKKKKEGRIGNGVGIA